MLDIPISSPLSYDPGSKESIMSIEDWAMVLASPIFRKRLEPDLIARTNECWKDFYARLTKLGRTGSFWR